jgi:hypothetical protein
MNNETPVELERLKRMLDKRRSGRDGSGQLSRFSLRSLSRGVSGTCRRL